jgi:hypothetical protein
MFFPQIELSRRVVSIRACPRVPDLMSPSRTRGLLSIKHGEADAKDERSPPQPSLGSISQPAAPSIIVPVAGNSA